MTMNVIYTDDGTPPADVLLMLMPNGRLPLIGRRFGRLTENCGSRASSGMGEPLTEATARMARVLRVDANMMIVDWGVGG